MAGLTEFYCGWNEPSHAFQFKWLEYTFKVVITTRQGRHILSLVSLGEDYSMLRVLLPEVHEVAPCSVQVTEEWMPDTGEYL
jgi:hypothetical protein